MIELRMPSFGADMEDAVLVHWNVQPGEAVERGQIACVVETQKGAIDVEAWQPGTVARLDAVPGQRLPVGALLAVLAGEGEDWQTLASQAAATNVPTDSARQAASVAASAAAPVIGSSAPAPSPAPRASPAARKRAAELGVSLDALGASGKPITLEAVERAAAGAMTPSQAMRAAIGAAMTRSKREIPHYYLGSEIEVESALQWLEAWNAQRPLAERALFAALALRAVALALRDAPELNGHFIDGAFRPAPAVHLGIVAALRGGGLAIPTLHGADGLALSELMPALRDLLARARSGRMRSSDLADPTVSVSNLGDLGTDTVYGVIHPPQVALVGLGRVAWRPVVQERRVVAARTVHLTLAADHRVSDGLIGARFLDAVRERLANPGEP